MGALLSRAAAVLVLADASFATHTPACNDACQEAAPKSFEVVGAGLDGSCISDTSASQGCPDINGRYTLDPDGLAAAWPFMPASDPDDFPVYVADFDTGIPDDLVIVYGNIESLTSGSGLPGWMLLRNGGPRTDLPNILYFVADPHGQNGPPANNWQLNPAMPERSSQAARPAPHLDYGGPGLSTVSTALIICAVVGVGVVAALVATYQKKQRRIRDGVSAHAPPPASFVQRHQPKALAAPLLPPAHVAPPPAPTQAPMYGAAAQHGAGCSGGPRTIVTLLEEAKLSQYATAFAEAGCVEVDDIHDLADDDLKGIGLKGPELKRLRRKAGVAYH
jgi:hypothetical protein